MSITKCTMQIGGQDLYTKRSADTVTYSDTTVAQVLQNYKPPSADASDFGKQILQCPTYREFQQLLRLADNPLHDEADPKNAWTITGNPSPTSDHAKFDHALFTNSSHKISKKIPLSNIWTVSFFMVTSTSPGSESTIYFKMAGSHTYTIQSFFTGTGVTFAKDSNTSSLTYFGGYKNLQHYEIATDGSKTLFFVNGNLQRTYSGANSAANFTFYLGNNSTTYFSEFRVLDGICEHTAKFDAPTEKYSLTSDTVSLLHFD